MGGCQRNGLLQTMFLVCTMEGGLPPTRMPHAMQQAGLDWFDPAWNDGEWLRSQRGDRSHRRKNAGKDSRQARAPCDEARGSAE